ncbi:hypothetical protein BDW69DRAFT_189148 [Aspergillus filifer]
MPLPVLLGRRCCLGWRSRRCAAPSPIFFTFPETKYKTEAELVALFDDGNTAVTVESVETGYDAGETRAEEGVIVQATPARFNNHPKSSVARPTFLELERENEQLRAEVEILRAKTAIVSPSPRASTSRSDTCGLLRTPEVYENQLHLPHGETVHPPTVRSRADIHLPSRECSDVLLRHGFVWTAWIHFAVHEGTFLSEHETAWDSGPVLDNDPLWLAIYFAFIAMSLMFMTDDEAKEAGLPEASTSDLVRNWYDTAYFFLNEADFLRNYNLKTVQAIAILLGLGKSVGDFDSQPLLQSTGIRIGQIIGMDREPSPVSNNPVVQEIGRRTWWTLVICEWLSVPPRPPCIQEADFEVNLPLDLSDEELSALDMSGNKLQAHPRPVQYHLAMIAISKAVYRFQYRLARLDGNDTRTLEDIVLTADEDLATIISNLPSHLAEAPAPIDHVDKKQNIPGGNECQPWVSLQWRSLTLTLLTYRMRINRVLQHRWRRSQLPENDTLLARSKVICIESAITIITLVNQYKSALARHRPWAMTFYVFSAAMTLALEAHELPELESAEYLDNIKLCLSFLEILRDHNALAGRAIMVLTEFLGDNNS